MIPDSADLTLCQVTKLISYTAPSEAALAKHIHLPTAEHSILRAKVLDALAPNNAALVLRRTGWITTESCIVVKVIIFKLCQSHLFARTLKHKLDCALNEGPGD